MYRGINSVARAQKLSSKDSTSFATNSPPSEKIGYAQVYSYSCFPTAAGKDTIFRCVLQQFGLPKARVLLQVPVIIQRRQTALRHVPLNPP